MDPTYPATPMTRSGRVLRGERTHLERFWSGRRQEEFVWELGPAQDALPEMRVRRVSPAGASDPWIYVTVGAWLRIDDDAIDDRLEMLLLSRVEDPRHVELL
jgi:hypothetical protein